MAKRQREWAKRAREALIAALGGRCVLCDATNCLTIEHVDGRNWNLQRVDQSWRMSIYRREAAEGRLTVLCIVCNSAQSRKYHGRRPNGYHKIPEGKRTLLCVPVPANDGVPF